MRTNRQQLSQLTLTPHDFFCCLKCVFLLWWLLFAFQCKIEQIPIPATKPYTQSHVRLIYIQSKCLCVYVSVIDTLYILQHFVFFFFSLIFVSSSLTLFFQLLDTLHRFIYICIDWFMRIFLMLVCLLGWLPAM